MYSLSHAQARRHAQALGRGQVLLPKTPKPSAGRKKGYICGPATLVRMAKSANRNARNSEVRRNISQGVSSYWDTRGRIPLALRPYARKLRKSGIKGAELLRIIQNLDRSLPHA